MKTIFKYKSGLLSGLLVVVMILPAEAQRGATGGGFHGGGGGGGGFHSGGFSGASRPASGFSGNNGAFRTSSGSVSRGALAYRGGTGYFGGAGYIGGSYYRPGFGYYGYPHLGFYLNVPSVWILPVLLGFFFILLRCRCFLQPL